MKVLIVILVVTALAFGEDDIDWAKVKPAWTRLPLLPANIQFPEEWTTYWQKHFSKGNRIVGGDEVPQNSIPYQAGLILTASDGTYFCGGSLISPRYVLTAAHCLEDVTEIQVRLGAHLVMQQETTQVRVTATSWMQHEDYDEENILNDIGIIDLGEEVTTSDAIQVASLPGYSDENNDFTGETARVSGWGLDSDNSTAMSTVLREVFVNVIGNFICDIQFLGAIEDTQICTSGTGGRGACNGDSGGPLALEGNILIGTVSFGVAIGCEVGWPTVYARTTSYLDWIAANSDVTIAS